MPFPVRRMNTYEYAVMAYLRSRRVRFRRIQDDKRFQLPDGSTRKNFDFLVEDPVSGGGVLLEVKGRHFPTTGGAVWENWITGDDLNSLEAWSVRFGKLYTPLIVFAYKHTDFRVKPGRPWTPFDLEHMRFGFVAASLFGYMQHCRLRSRRWKTYSVPKASFLNVIRPLTDYLPESDPTLVDLDAEHPYSRAH